MEPLNTDCPVRWQAIHNGQAIALQTQEKSITFIQLDQQLLNLQKQLAEQIIVDQEQTPIRLICIAKNCIELVFLQLLCLRLGWLFCPLNPRFTDTEIQIRLAILNSHYCWMDQTNQERLKTIHALTLDFTDHQNQLTTTQKLEPITIIPEQACNIIFTSGSSGFPKAIVHCYANHFFSAKGSQATIPLTRIDQNLLSLPLFHIGGYATVMRTLLAGGCLHITDSPLDTSLLKRHKITHLSLVSTQLKRLLNDPSFHIKQSTIKHILLGGSAFSETLLSELASRGFQFHLSYGCTEMASQVATSRNSIDLKILPYRQIKIINDEVYCRGETRCIGYFENNNIRHISPAEWLNMKDVGCIVNENLQILGRKDRQFISGGENIIPEEIERVCLQHNTVEKVYICAIKDQQYGQRVVAFVDFDTPSTTHFQQQCSVLENYLSTQLTRFKRPDRYFQWPKTDKNQIKIPKQIFLSVLAEQGLL
jgi:O-succinylbenzoic acid--CoA ligase